MVFVEVILVQFNTVFKMLGVILAMLWYGYLGEETNESLDKPPKEE